MSESRRRAAPAFTFSVAPTRETGAPEVCSACRRVSTSGPCPRGACRADAALFGFSGQTVVLEAVAQTDDQRNGCTAAKCPCSSDADPSRYRSRSLTPMQWARHYERCVRCGRTDAPHKGNGACARCQQYLRRERRRRAT